ncbi:MAG: 4Fe-4S dicluster domain-containing protein [Zoogloeaceae bacterium]|uniref:4Fe-4S dicluster domain-containing protein n=1 Tax=Denitromonas sp. TaxID=2734609 RepID=UPI001DC70A9F|nr:4Fe-4S dicluster domain-containing protein [Rhodocyclaceae bacterium]MCP5222130.1 4Fe-4S dicluster domain-containing protein [Zoogloeaceae bacterium]HPR06617.1 4Fe-4S dicluster domain-containing protein [Denitromonas sp.]
MSQETESGPAVPAESEAASAPRAKKGGAAPRSNARALEARRRFIRSAVMSTGVVGAGLAGYLPVAAQADNPRLRPPGALDENDFLSSCIKCGQCVQVCPVQAIVLGDITDGFGLGVPHIESREQACDFSCDAVQCILACPTGALVYRKPDFLKIRQGAELAHKPVLKAKANDPEPTLNLIERAGLARLSRPDACLAMQGKGFKGQTRGADFKGQMRYMDVDRWAPIAVADHPYERDLCDLCVTECPIQDAIRLEVTEAADGSKRGVPVVMEQCVGCGVCEMICPVEPTAIVVDSRAVWEGEA